MSYFCAMFNKSVIEFYAVYCNVFIFTLKIIKTTNPPHYNNIIRVRPTTHGSTTTVTMRRWSMALKMEEAKSPLAEGGKRT